MTFSQEERRQLADLFRQVGPDAPTLCEGWTTRDLAVHLVLRENRPDAAGGMFVPALKERLEKVTAEYEAKPFDELVDTRSEEHTSELQSRFDLVCRLLLEKKKR